jgi:hypothetical protein
MYLTQSQLLETLIVAGIILMLIWWGFKSGFFWFVFCACGVVSAIYIILNVFNYTQTF